jgi:cytidyltransferase-like protein
MTPRIGWANVRYGVVLGRFQPLHLGHMEYLEASRKEVDQLVIGITNPDPNTLIHDGADPLRSKIENNPFSYFDRYQMIAASLGESDWESHEFIIVPAPINSPQDMKPYLPPPSLTTVYITVYGPWGDRKAELVRSLGYSVSILWRRDPRDRLTSGTKIREAMTLGKPWQELVPAAVARYLEQSGWSAALVEQALQAGTTGDVARGRPTGVSDS